MFKVVLILIVVSVFSMNALAQDTDDPKKWAENFLGIIIDKGEIEANRVLAEETWLGGKKRNAILAIRGQMKEVGNINGVPVNFEFLKENKFGSRTVVLFYMLNRTVVPIMWRFSFYRQGPLTRKTSWNLIHFKYFGKPEEYPDHLYSNN